MDLKEKLRQLDSGPGPVQPPLISRSGADIDQYITGAEVANQFGKYYCARIDFPQDAVHGRFSLDHFNQGDADLFRFVGKDKRLKGLDLRKSVFLDIDVFYIIVLIFTFQF